MAIPTAPTRSPGESSMRPQDRVGTAAIEVALGAGAATIMAVAILLSTFGCNNGLILSGPRVYYAMARDRLFFERAGTAAPGLPHPGLRPDCSGASGPSVLCISGTYSELLNYVVFAALIFYLLTTVALFRLRRLRPDLPRPVKAFGYPVLPALYICALAFLLVVLLIYRSGSSPRSGSSSWPREFRCTSSGGAVQIRSRMLDFTATGYYSCRWTAGTQARRSPASGAGGPSCI